MTQPQNGTAIGASSSQQQGEEDDGDTQISPSLEKPLGGSNGSSKSPTGAADDDEDEGEGNDDNAESSSTSSSGGQGSGEGYTADCSSDASSDLSGSAKKKEKDNMIVSVNNLSIDDGGDNDENDAEAKEEEEEDEEDGGGESKGSQSLAAVANHPQGSQSTNNGKEASPKDKKKKKGKKKRDKSKASFVAEGAGQRRQEAAYDSSDGDSDMADVEDEGIASKPAQWNGVQVVHPMDPRIDISKVGYLHGSPGEQHSNTDIQLPNVAAAAAGSKQDSEAPSLENYVQLMEVVRPFFNSHGIGSKDASNPPTGDPTARTPAAMASRRPRTAYGPSAGDSRTSTSLTGTRSSSSNSSGKGRRRDAPLHFQQAATHAAKAPQVPLQLAARQKPLAAAAAAEFYAPDDDPADRDEDDSDTSSMVVLARTKKKHKQHFNNASESASQADSRSFSGANSNADRNNLNAGARPGDAMEDAENDEDDRKPAARPQAPLQEENVGNQHPEHPPAEDEAAQGNASSSSSGGDQRHQAAANQARHNYDVSHVVTESASNTNTTTSGSASGSGGNSGSNQGSSGSGNGSSGSGNGSSGSGNEGKGSSEDVGTKEENSGEGNSNSEDINSDDRKQDDQKEIAHSLTARRHGAGASADTAANDPMKLDAPSPQAPNEQVDAARERKLQDKKRKRMNMRREYEEKVQQEMESSESSAAHNAITLRPGRPVTLDKVLSFTKIARMVIQAGPPFLVVHTNAAYTRLTGIDAHAAVGKPVSTLLSVQGPDRLSSMNQDEGPREENVARAAAAPGSSAQHGARQFAEAPQNQMGAFEVATISANTNNGQRLGQSHAEAEEAGRARAAQAIQNDSGNINLERLVAACGFGKYHVLHARARPHQMVGRNVTFVNKAGTTAALPPSSAGGSRYAMRKQDDGSSDTSLTSNFEGPFESLKCRSSISPIISDTVDSAVVTDNNQESHSHKNKRRKHHHHSSNADPGSAAASRSTAHHHRRSFPGKDSAVPKRYQQYVTHYAIQLEVFDDSKELNDRGSSSSTSVEANLLGLTKAEVRRQRQAAQAGEHGTSQEDSEQQPQPQDDDDEQASETTEGTVPVTAVG